MANAVRANIPRTRQTDPAFFPDYEFRRYPAAMVDEHGYPIYENPVYLMTTPANPNLEPEHVMRKGPDGIKRPALLGGNPIIVNDAEEEEDYVRLHPGARSMPVEQHRAPAAQSPALGLVRPAVGPSPELLAARAEVAELEELAARRRALTAEVEAPVRRKPGPKPKVPAEVAQAGGAANEAAAEVAQAGGAADAVVTMTMAEFAKQD